MHVPDENLPRYRRLMALVRKIERIGNNRSNRGDYPGANAAWRRSSEVSTAAQSLRVMGLREMAWREMARETQQQMVAQLPKENNA